VERSVPARGATHRPRRRDALTLQERRVAEDLVTCRQSPADASSSSGRHVARRRAMRRGRPTNVSLATPERKGPAPS
jgi:hypothetical protein